MAHSPSSRPAVRSIIAVVPICLASLLALSGCGPRVVLNPPEGWPAEWKGRRIYNTPNAYIYASSDRAAGEADRLVQSVAKDFADQGGKPTKGMVIVSKRGDPPITTDPKAFWIAVTYNHSTTRPTQDAGTYDEEWTRIVVHEAKRMSLSPAQGILVYAHGVPRHVLASVLEPPRPVIDETSWVVTLPTQSFMDWAHHEGSVNTFWKNQNYSLPERLLYSTLFVALDLAKDPDMIAGRETAIFSQLASRQSGWSEDERFSRTDDYHNRMLRRRLGILADQHWP